MHYWGDGFEHFAEVGEAADEIGQFCRRWGRLCVTQTKEKYGTARVYCMFGWHQLHSITHPGYAYSQYPKWFWNIDCSFFGRIIPKFNWLVIPYQKIIYRMAYRRALEKYPFIREEILAVADYDEYLKGL